MRRFIGPLLLVLAAAAILPMDVGISEFAVRSSEQFDEVGDLLENCSTFGHAVGATVAMIAICLLDVRNRRNVPRLWGLVIGSGLVAASIKLLVARARPNSLDLSSATLAETFSGWLPLLPHHSNLGSFPSAHTAVAVALACVLSRLYPRGLPLFALLAALVGMERVQSGAHFASDVLIGAAVGRMVTLLADVKWGIFALPVQIPANSSSGLMPHLATYSASIPATRQNGDRGRMEPVRKSSVHANESEEQLIF